MDARAFSVPDSTKRPISDFWPPPFRSPGQHRGVHAWDSVSELTLVYSPHHFQCTWAHLRPFFSTEFVPAVEDPTGPARGFKLARLCGSVRRPATLRNPLVDAISPWTAKSSKPQAVAGKSLSPGQRQMLVEFPRRKHR